MHHATQLTSHNSEQFDTFRSPSLAQIRNPINRVFFCRQKFPESLFSPRNSQEKTHSFSSTTMLILFKFDQFMRGYWFPFILFRIARLIVEHILLTHFPLCRVTLARANASRGAWSDTSDS
jgi:hypothetical protein